MYADTKREGEAHTSPTHPMAVTFMKAADAIERFGHIKGCLGGPVQGMCLIGALNFVQTGSSITYHKANLIPVYCFKMANGLEDVNLAHDFNDLPSTTKEQVVAALRKTAQWIEVNGVTAS